MKRITLLFLLSTLFALPSFAHAGIYDRYLDIAVSYEAMLTIVFVTHLIGVLFAKYTDFAFISRLRQPILRLVKHIHRNEIGMYFVSWILCSIVLGVYLILIAQELFIFGYYLIPTAFIAMHTWIFNEKSREKYLCGPKITFYYIRSSVLIIIGLVLYARLLRHSYFKSLFAYTDPEYILGNIYLYPDPEAVFPLCKNVLYLSLIFLTPYLTYGIYRIIRHLRSSCLHKRKSR